MPIPTPSNIEVDFYLKQWDGLENYVLQENSLRKLFTITYPRNNCIEDILIKVCSLNVFYSTNIFSPFMVAKHILALQIDHKLERNDLGLVNEIAEIEMNGGKKRNFYSFATKYCSHHKPEEYPIYDSYVEKILLYFKKTDNFYRFDKNELKQYIKYKNILMAFQNYTLTQYSLKQIDKYLWQAGKKYFPKKYK
jgi:hypothetical protein